MITELQIDSLNRKKNEIKQNYEEAKERRIDIVNSMQELDNMIDQSTRIIDEAKENFIDNHFNILKLKNIFSTYFITFISQWSLAILINLLINSFSKGIVKISPISIISSGLFIYTFNVINYKVINRNKKNTKKKAKKVKLEDIEQLEHEKTLLIEQRLNKGVEYKRAREEEVLREKIYKKIEPIITTIIMSIMEGKTIQQEKQEISTKDIYYKIKLDPTFDFETIDNKKDILDEELRKYLSLKISEIYYNVINYQDLYFLSAEELVMMLINETAYEKHNDILNNIIHAVLNFCSYLQGYGVIWVEEDDEQLIESPKLSFDEEGKLTELKTHKKTNYITLFNIVYNTFININKQNKIKSRNK